VKISFSSATSGHLLIVLHAHLPYIRYPEHEHHLEENWFYEAVTETYIPLLDVLGKLINDGLDFRITLSLTPSLIEMFNDTLLRTRYLRYLERLIELSEKELFRTRKDSSFHPLAKMYHDKFLRIKQLYDNSYKKDLTSAFWALMDSGKAEIITCAATHAYLPALMIEPSAVKAQINLAAEHFRSAFGKKPNGMWLPECGFAPGIDQFIKGAGIDFFFLESHGLLNSVPKSRYSIYAPVKTPAGVVAFARDVDSAKQVWSSAEGYPGDPVYRDFYRDIGFDLDYEYIKPYLPGGIRTFTGMKYFRITGKSDDKAPYIPAMAVEKAKIHAENFFRSKSEQIYSLNEKLKIKPLVIAAYDAELFGHWWYEGVEWLDFFIRKSVVAGKFFGFVTASEYISANMKHLEIASPAYSSWGNKGYSTTWIDKSNSWIYKHIRMASKLMVQLAAANKRPNKLIKRALNQAARELLLAQASDWQFMIKTNNSADFAKNKFKEHIADFFLLYNGIITKHVDLKKLSYLENKNAIFPDIDYRIYANPDTK